MKEVLLLRLELAHEEPSGVVLAGPLILTTAPASPAEPEGLAEILHHPRHGEAAATKKPDKETLD